jgi:molecular chaperone DnaJ
MGGDHFKTLGVGQSANADDIKTAFRKLALEHHPDRCACATR